MALRELLGRNRELADLEAALEAARAGRGSVFLLSGEAGIGKTRLAEELGGLAKGRGAAVYWGRAWEVQGAPALWPWWEILRACALGDPGKDLLQAEPLAGDLAPLLSRRGPAPGGREPELDLIRLGPAVLALLRALSTVHPLVLVFDDLHACDLASLELLRLVAPDLPALRVLVIGTYREVEARRRPRVPALLGRVARSGASRSLARLDLPVVTRWLEQALGTPPAPALAAAVFTATEGNPLFVDALAQLLASRGQGATLPAGFALPDGIRATIEEMLVGIPDEARQVLDAASVLGRQGSVPTLQLVCERTLEQVLGAVDHGVAAGVLERQALPSSPVRFAHVLIREGLYQALPPSRRVGLHAACARALARLAPDEPLDHLAERAHHAFEGAPLISWLESADLSARAGQQALELLAFDDAARHLERALAALEHAGSADDAARAELLWRLGVAHIRLGQVAQGREACERSALLAERAGRPEILARAALALGAELVPGRVDARLVELLEAALRAGPGDPALRARVMARLAAALMPTLVAERPLGLAREAIAAARALEDRRVLAQVLATARGALTPAQGLPERVAMDRELASLASELGDGLLQVQAHGRLALDAIEAGDPEAAENELAVEQRLAERIRVPEYRLRAASKRVLWASLQGSADRIAGAEDELRGLCEQFDDTRGLATLLANRALRAELRGDVAGAISAYLALEKLIAAEPWAAWWFPLRRAGTLVHQGRHAEAREQLQRFAPDGPLRAHGVVGPAILAQIAGLSLRLGDREWTARVYALLLDFSTQHAVHMALLVSDGPVGYHLGCLAAELGRPGPAAAHLRDAIARSERAGFPGFAARARRALDGLGQAPPPPPPAADALPRLERQGELWTLSHQGRELRLKDSKGLHYLAALLGEPGRELHVGDLLALTSDGATSDGSAVSGAELSVGRPGDAGALLDQRAKADYRRRLEQIQQALEDAELAGARDAIDRLQREREAIGAELARAVGLGGRDRKAGASSERARINVQRRLRDVLKRVSELDAPLARHLERHLRTGVFCCWEP